MNTSVNVSAPGVTTNITLMNVTEVAGRFLLSLLFLLSGFGKITAYGATAAYMSASGVPSALLPVVIATELLSGLAIVLGWKTRVVALPECGASI